MKLTGKKSERNNIVTEVELTKEESTKLEAWEAITLTGPRTRNR